MGVGCQDAYLLNSKEGASQSICQALLSADLSQACEGGIDLFGLRFISFSFPAALPSRASLIALRDRQDAAETPRREGQLEDWTK